MIARLTAISAVASIAATMGLLAIPAQATPFPGPDGGGYRGVEIANNLRHIDTSGGTALNLDDDAVSGVISLPFTFDFYGSAFNAIRVSNNGFINFDLGAYNGCCQGLALPTHGFASHIGGLWVDLFNDPGTNSPFTGTLGSASDREFVIGWYDEHEYRDGPRNTFEIILHEMSDDIELQYGSLDITDSHRATAGIESPDGQSTLSLFESINSGSGLGGFSNRGFCFGTGDLTCGVASTSVPEPSSLALMGTFLAGIGWLRRRRHS